jgi:hypothetical protein
MAILRIGGKKKPKAVVLASDAEAKKASSGGSMKALVYLVLILDVLALGGWLYVKYSMNRKAQNELKTAESNLRSLKERGETGAAIVQKLVRENAQSISQPQDIINKVFRDHEILDQLANVSTGLPRSFRPNENYEEVVVSVNWAQKAGYALTDLVRVLKAIEDTNPMVQIKDMDFGKRDIVGPTELKSWRPTKMTVRILRPATRR